MQHAELYSSRVKWKHGRLACWVADNWEKAMTKEVHRFEVDRVMLIPGIGSFARPFRFRDKKTEPTYGTNALYDCSHLHSAPQKPNSAKEVMVCVRVTRLELDEMSCHGIWSVCLLSSALLSVQSQLVRAEGFCYSNSSLPRIIPVHPEIDPSTSFRRSTHSMRVNSALCP